jgi:hypothetical protein
MWLLNEETPTFRALSYGDKLRVGRSLTLGKAPDDPRLAAAAVELGDSYQRKSRVYIAFARWAPLFAALSIGWIAGSQAIEGDWTMGLLCALIVFTTAWTFAFDPITRPRNLARGMKASRRIATGAPSS